MPDESNDLRPLLARLHDQLRAAPNVNAETRALLQGVMQDIHALLAASTAEVDADADTAGDEDILGEAERESIARRLATAEREFEATHPTLAAIVGRLIDGFGRMGI